MSGVIRTIVLNTDEQSIRTLRAKLLTVEGLRIISEVDEPALFESTISKIPADLAVVNLDPEPEMIIFICEQVIPKYPEVVFFAVSESNAPDLILRAMRAGFREFLLRPIDEGQLQEAINRISKFSSAKKKTGKLICCFGTAGGVGTTTISTNLACEFAQISRRGSIIVDLDLFYGHVATLLDITPQFTIADLCQTLDAIDISMIERAVINHEVGVKVLARPLHFAQAQAISAPNVSSLLDALIETYDYVVCDGPTRMDVMGPMVIELADLTLMVLIPTVCSVRNADRILREMEREGYNLDKIKLVLSQYTNDDQSLALEDIEDALGRKIFAIIPYDLKSVNSSINMGVPLIKSFPKSKVRDSIRRLALQIHDPEQQLLEEADAQRGSRKGLLARLMSK